jgi:Predicted molecular chaperone distantly related to HSP70-fold metalloproteases
MALMLLWWMWWVPTDLKVQLVAGKTFPYPANLRSQILSVCSGSALSMAELAELDDAIAQEFATAALTIQAEYDKAELIGSHGQTVYHRPARKAEKEIAVGSWATACNSGGAR